MSAQSYHHDNLRETLLELAETSVRTSGADSLSLRQLARDAGVSHAAPARHFRDRQALLDALALTGFERLNAQLAEAAAPTAPFESSFRALANAYVRFAVENPELLNLMFAVKHADGASDELQQAGSHSLRAVVSIIASAQEAGEVIAGDPERFAMVVFAGVHGVAALATGGLLGELAVDEATATTSQLLVRALKPHAEP